MHEAPEHPLNKATHTSSITAVAKRKLVLCRCEAKGANHHRRERVGELAFEHRAFAGDDPVVLPHLAIEKRRVNVWEIKLLRAFEIALRAAEVLRHHAEIDMIRAENAPDLPQHLLHAHVAAGVACSV